MVAGMCWSEVRMEVGAACCEAKVCQGREPSAVAPNLLAASRTACQVSPVNQLSLCDVVQVARREGDSSGDHWISLVWKLRHEHVMI